MLVFTFLLCISVCNAQYFKRESDFYPCLDVIVSNYFNHYFRYPDKAEDLILFAEYFLKTYPNVDNSCKNNLNMEILPYLRKNMKHILIEEDKGNTYTMRMDNDTLLYISSSFWPFSPCEDSLFIGGNPTEYYHYNENLRIPRFYSSHNKAILYPDSVYQDFKREVLNIQHKYIVLSNSSLPYKFYIYKNDTVPILSMLEYNWGEPLRYYCSGEPVKSNFPFYRKLNSYLKRFCKLYKCKRILFTLPDYNITDDESEDSLHPLLHPILNKQRIDRISTYKPCQHGYLHHEPERPRIPSQHAVFEEHEMNNGHPAVHAYLPGEQ